MLMAMALFITNDAMMKLAREVFPTGQALFLRNSCAIFVCFALVAALGDWRKLHLGFRPLVLLRGVVEGLTAICIIWSIGYLPLATITAIGMTAPLIIVLIAAALGIERVGWRRTSALIVGFVGVVIVVRPTADGFNSATLVALFSTLLVTARDLLTRRIDSATPSTVISLVTMAVACLPALAMTGIETWQPVWQPHAIYLACAAAFMAAASLCIVQAFRVADIGVVAGYRYSVVVMAVVAGYLVWGHIPDAMAFLGIGLIVGSGLYTMHRQRVRPDSRLKPGSGLLQ